MHRLSLVGVTLAISGGCSIIYDVDDLRGAPDATPIDAVLVDGDPADLMIVDAEPMQVFEGTGSDGGRPVAIVVNGSSLIDPTVTAVLDPGGPTEMTLEPIDVGRSADMNRLSFTLVIPVLTDLAEGEARTLRITVEQADAEAMPLDLTVNGLDELEPTVATLSAASLAPLYSRITIDSALHVTGTEPARLRATAGVTITAAVDVNASSGTAGAGGCNGGGPGAAGGCLAGGGRPGANNASLLNGFGGGGGGFADIGTMGEGAEGGAGGAESGNDMLVPFGDDGNTGNGGGGGGAGTLGMGGAGGGGGGAIEISAGGILTISDAVTAAGDTGTSANGAGGGGGSGGAILVRAYAMLVGAGADLAAPGAPGSTANPNSGGAGSEGRIRFDVASGTISSAPTAIRGPMWAIDTPTIVADAQATLVLHGHPNRELGVFVRGTPTGNVRVEADGNVDVDVALAEGHNLICAAYTTIDDANLGDDAAQTCVDVVRR